MPKSEDPKKAKKSRASEKRSEKKGDEKKSSDRKRKKKDAQFVIRLDRDLRDQFVDICAELDTSAAREVRRFITKFIRRYEAGELDS